MNRTCEIHDTILQDDLKLRERPLKVLAAVDSFKGSMTSVQAGMAVKKGLEKNYKNCEIEVVPVADGGEGTMDAIAYGKSNMKRHTVNVTGPLGQVVKASYISYDEAGEKVALIEMAEAAGLPLVPESARNPMHTTTYGVGEMIKDAMLHGCRSFIIGIGGSATNDAGIGMLQALGCHFLDEHGNEEQKDFQKYARFTQRICYRSFQHVHFRLPVTLQIRWLARMDAAISLHRKREQMLRW